MTKLLTIFFLYAAGFSSIFLHSCDGKVIMEYIGATGVPITFNSVPIYKGVDFYFILSFAIDSTPSGRPRNGKFSPYWQPTLTPESVSDIKSRHPNVKILASLSGFSIGDTVLHWYDPANPDRWISNAVKSLSSIVRTYSLDGLDVDYEIFPEQPGPSSFAYCIGELIARLKDRGVISVATIVPFASTVGHYVELFGRYGDVIDFVNYQFYTERVSSPKSYLEAFRARAEQFDEGKILQSYEVDGRGIQGDRFFDALRLIESDGFEVNGVMIFSADASRNNGYHLERESQEFLLNSKANA